VRRDGAACGEASLARHDVSAISAGGGCPSPTRAATRVDTDHYFKLWDDARRRLAEELATRCDWRSSPAASSPRPARCWPRCRRQDMGANHFVLCDAGFNDMVRPAMYGGHHAISLIARADAPGAARRDPAWSPARCANRATCSRRTPAGWCKLALPSAEVGDLLVFHDAGPTAPR
jgi:diaminopimelate decarboxylase